MRLAPLGAPLGAADWFIEGVFCIVYIIDSMIVLTFVGKRRWLKHESWIFILAMFMFFDIIFVTFRAGFHYPFLRFLRPAFFASRRRHIKSCFASMVKAGFECMPLLLILTFLVVVFAVIGWITFDSGQEVSERSERALRKTRILALDLAKWLQTKWLHPLTTKLTLFHSIRLARSFRSCFI